MVTRPEVLSIWTVYDHPLDYPEGFIARRHRIVAGSSEPTADALTGPTLDAVRSQLPPGLYNIGRDASDEPQIVESWI